jgi:type IV pilus assembly protein PilC
MTYPTVVFVIAIIAVIGMLLFIVPIFAGMFDDLGGELPAPTKVLVFLSAVVKFGAPFFVVGGIAFLVVWQRIKHLERVRSVIDPVKLKMPVFGKLFQKVALSRFTRNLGTMLTSGVPILQSLDIVGETSGNTVLVKASRDIQESVRRGESLTGPLADHWIFPPMVVQMMAVGEDTAPWTPCWPRSRTSTTKRSRQPQRHSQADRALMIAVLGGIIGSMIIALYMPIFKVFDLIK